MASSLLLVSQAERPKQRTRIRWETSMPKTKTAIQPENAPSNPRTQRQKKDEKKSSQGLNSGPTHSRDLVFQDLSVVLVPGMRLSCLPRARRERAALRAHRESGACGAARAPRERSGACGAARAPRERSVRRCARTERAERGVRRS